MTSVDQTQPLYGPGSDSYAAASNQSNTEDNSTISSDFETFLKMLTVQMQNQDPLNPVESTEFATQLATFSSVEQQVLTNDLLKAMSANLTGDALQRMSGWVGMEALVQAPVGFDGTPISVRPDYPDGADNAFLVVRNAAGDVVERSTLEPDQTEVTWTGLDANGVAYPADSYSFEVEAYAGEEQLETEPAAVYSQIYEVRNAGSDMAIRLSGGDEVAANAVIGLRAPQP